MQYLEELESGSCIFYNSEYFLLTSDFKSNGNRLVISMNNGIPRWLSSSAMVDNIDIFTFDKDTNILPIKQRKNVPNHISDKNTNIS